MSVKSVKLDLSVVDKATGEETFGIQVREGQVDMPDVIALEQALMGVMNARLDATAKKIAAAK